MLNFTPIVKPYFGRVDRQMLSAADSLRDSQLATLGSLVAEGEKTVWGKEHGFNAGMNYDRWHSVAPLVDYEKIRPYVMSMVAGKSGVLWPVSLVSLPSRAVPQEVKASTFPLPTVVCKGCIIVVVLMWWRVICRFTVTAG